MYTQFRLRWFHQENIIIWKSSDLEWEHRTYCRAEGCPLLHNCKYALDWECTSRTALDVACVYMSLSPVPPPPPPPIEYLPALLCLFLHWSVTSWLKVVWYCLRVFVLVIRSAMIADYVYWLSGDGKPTISKLIKLYWQVRTDRPPDACMAPAPNHKPNEWLLLKRLATDIPLCISISQKACIAEKTW